MPRILSGKEQDVDRNRPRNWHNSEIDDTYGLFTGGRALSENLQLDRAMPPIGNLQQTVALDTIKGIEIKEMDWKPLIKDAKPELDALASIVPADQHAIFFPSFAAFIRMIDEADKQGTPVLHLFEPRAEDSLTKERYQKQLGLSLSGLGCLVGPQVINSVGITGSDPYLRTGSDIAMLYEAKDINPLRALVSAQVAMNVQGSAAKPASGEIAGIAWSGFVSPDRSVCSYMATVGNAVVITNSLKQLERIIAAQQGKTPALAAQGEYIFFRDRYKKSDANETALIVLTDATIRRWCGPRWRIADSRRTRAAAVMASVQANNMDDLAKKTAQAGPVQVARPDAGALQMTASGVNSSIYNTLDFMTPIVELDMDKVTGDEANAYVRWRDNYQRNWSNYFDPIAVRFAITDDAISADMTVWPLIAGSDYKELIELTRGVKLALDGGDPHDSLLHYTMAINKDSEPMKEIMGFAKKIGLNVDPLSWLGNSVSIYVDADPAYLAKLAKAVEGGKEPKPEALLPQLPVALRAESTSPLKLTLFLAGVRAYIEGAAPQLTTWETLTHKEQGYVKVGPSGKAKDDMKDMPDFAVYYVALPEALVLSLNEDVIKHVIDRVQARAAAKAENKPLPATRPWLGSSFAARGSAYSVGRRAPVAAPVSGPDEAAGLGQHPHPQRMETSLSRPGSRESPRAILADETDLPRRR